VFGARFEIFLILPERNMGNCTAPVTENVPVRPPGIHPDRSVIGQDGYRRIKLGNCGFADGFRRFYLSCRACTSAQALTAWVIKAGRSSVSAGVFDGPDGMGSASVKACAIGSPIRRARVIFCFSESFEREVRRCCGVCSSTDCD
jgi:hypothetical protein